MYLILYFYLAQSRGASSAANIQTDCNFARQEFVLSEEAGDYASEAPASPRRAVGGGRRALNCCSRWLGCCITSVTSDVPSPSNRFRNS